MTRTPACPRLPGRLAGLCGLIGILALVACATSPETAPTDCTARLQALETLARSRDLDPGYPRPVPGFPELGTDRVLGAVELETLTADQFAAWLERLAEAGARRRALLRSALGAQQGPASAGTATAPLSPPDAKAEEACAARLSAARTWNPAQRDRLRAAVAVPDVYRDVARLIGLYPITSRFARAGIEDLQAELLATFATPLADLPRAGKVRRFAPAPDPASAPAGPHALALDALGVRISRTPTPVLETLFRRHAPVLEVDVAGPSDRPGVPYFEAPGRPTVDGSRPTAYRYARVMPLAGRLRLQLSYVFWFRARPKSGALDTLGGAMDGLVWRVTLDDRGEPLGYDSMHPCGCYHQFFPTARLRLRDAAAALPEPPLVPQGAPALGPGERLVVRLASGTHYIQRVYAAGEPVRDAALALPVEAYVQRPYDDLYAVAAPDGPRSLFDGDGLVPGTARGERFYLWPMGVPSPGAMRDRGRHATAFLGRRHFDDADLLDGLFEFTTGETGPPAGAR